MADDEDDKLWKHRVLKLMMAGTFFMMAMCAAFVYHIFKG
jgi:hypothetical protein